MRNSTIVLTAAVAVVAGGLAWGVNQPGGLRSFWHGTAGEQVATTTADVNGGVMDGTDTNAPTAADNAMAMMTGEDTAAASSEQENQAAPVPAADQKDVASNDASSSTPTTGETQTGGMTPIDLDKASARLNGETPSAGAQTDAGNNNAVSDTPKAKAENFKVDVDAALVDRTIGSPAAPITVYDFSSLSCPHCAMFHNTILPQIKEEYIDKGLVRWVFKGFPLNEPALKAEMLARCAPDNQYIALEDLMYKNQERWAYTEDPLPNLSLLVKISGITEDMFVSCVNDKDLETRLAKSIQDNAEKYKLTSTPTFVLNDGKKTIVGAGSFNGFAADLDYMLRELKVEPPVHKIPASVTEF